MNIQEIEKRTGVPKQNIRFYEKEGLIRPERNALNGYRDFTEQDVERIKLIKLLRKLDFPLSNISGLLEGQLDFAKTVEEQIDKLAEKSKEFEICIGYCRELKEEAAIEDIDIDYYLNDMDEKERAGNKFFDFLADVKAVYDAELQKSFVFEPHTIIRSKRDFTDALLDYAQKNNHLIIITKESMYPEFTLDGVEYIAASVTTRFGTSAKCTMKHPEDVEPNYISKKKRKYYRRLVQVIPAVILFLILFLILNRDRSPESLVIAFLCSLGVTVIWMVVIPSYK